MLILAEWINQYLARELSMTELTEALESAGIEVEGVQHPPEFDDKLIAADVVDIKPHPNADKLQLAVVATAEDRYEVVCGAPNLARGQKAALARPGAKLPGGESIKRAEIRGVHSEGMLCSESELGLSNDHEGIIDLGSEVEAGTPLNSLYLSDYTLIDITTAANRWDLQNYRGIAREVAAHTGVDFVDEKVGRIELGSGKEDKIFTNHIPEQVTDYGLVRLKSRANVPLSEQVKIRRRLRLSGIKPINSVVDATNYAMLVTGQPLHAFDADKVQGDIEVRFAHKDESIRTLDGAERTLVSDDIVIADNNGPIALAGVIGGADAEISNSTEEIIVEAATFPSVYVRKTAQRHGLRTEASSRFERQLPMQTVVSGLQYVASVLQESDEVEVLNSHHERNEWPWVQHIGLEMERARKVTGLEELSKDQVVSHLKSLGFEAEAFDITSIARSHIGKPYKLGAKFKTDGTDAFDCSYLVDYIYSLIGVSAGHTAHQQHRNGSDVALEDLLPGDLLFRGGPWVELDESERDGISHVALYIGDGKIIEARDYVRDNEGEWSQLPPEDRKVVESDVDTITKDPQFVGAKRCTNNLEDYIRITVPWWRPDVIRPEDIIEEVVKLIGLEEIPVTLPPWHPINASSDWNLRRRDEVRWLLYGLGGYEVTTYPFISEADISLFKQSGSHFKLANPRSQEQAYLRTSLLPLLGHSVVNNATYKDKFAIFELATIFRVDDEEKLPKEREKLGIAYRSDDILDLKRYLDALFEHAQIAVSIDMRTSERDCLHPARQAVIATPENDELGWFGVVHPDITTALKSSSPLLYAEIDVPELQSSWNQPDFQAVPRYQSSYRDLTLQVAPDITWQQVVEALSTVDDVECEFKDEYYKDGQKALTIHLELQAKERTLSEDDITAKIERIADTLKQAVGAEITL